MQPCSVSTRQVDSTAWPAALMSSMNAVISGFGNRTLADAALTDALLATQGTPEGLYGRWKTTHWLPRQGLADIP